MSKKRKQSSVEKVNIMPVYILCVLTIIALVVMILVLVTARNPRMGDFVPPAFESMAVQGTPDVPDELDYSTPYQDGMAYRFSVCGYMTMDSNKAVVYFTNAAENDVYLKLRLLDVNGKTLGETGLLKPDEYVKDVELNVIPSAGTGIILKIMSYEPDTYMSAGSVTLKTTIGE